MISTVRVELPASLCRLARAPQRLELTVTGAVTQGAILDALESLYPAIEGCLRDHLTKRRRPFIRFFACGEDFSHAPPDDPLPLPVASGHEPFVIIGAVAGG